MRVFKHGDVLAIVFPKSMADSSSLQEGEELEFAEIEKGLFVLARKEKIAELLKPKVEQYASSSKPFKSQENTGLGPFLKRELEKNGFVVVFGEKGAQALSVDLEKEIKSGEVIGSRGFDKNFYLATRGFVEENAPKAFKALQSPCTVGQMAEKTKLSEDGAKALLCILMEQGEVIEKKKGVFAAA